MNERMEDGWYILCPKCKKLTVDGWIEIYSETNKYSVSITNNSSNLHAPDMEYENDETIDSEFLITRHSCNGIDEYFESEAITVEELLVKIENGKVVNAGMYWRDELDKLKEIMGEKGIEVDIKTKSPYGGE